MIHIKKDATSIGLRREAAMLGKGIHFEGNTFFVAFTIK